MATLENIRKRSGLLIITIGVAMAAFILTDFLGSGESIIRGNQLLVGKVNGVSIDLPEFSERIDLQIEGYKSQSGDLALRNVTRKQFADVVWEAFIRDVLLIANIEKMGITVSDDELYNRIKNNPEIQQAPVFRDELSGQFSEARLQQYIMDLQDNRFENPDAANFWNQWKAFERQLREDGITGKYNTAIRLGLYQPAALAGERFNLSNRSRSMDIIPILYSSIEDDVVTVTESELKNYYSKNKEDFRIDEPYRNFEFVSISVTPSEEDKAEVISALMNFMEDQIVFNQRTGVNDTILAFANVEDDSAYVSMRSDLAFNSGYFRETNGFNIEFDSLLFNSEPGVVFGPFDDESGYIKLGKLSKVTTLPDSVEARHILISFAGAERSEAVRSFQEAKELADSIYEMLSSDISAFDSLSQAFNDDPTAANNGGDLGWFNDRTMTPLFSNFCFENEVGTVGIVRTEFGFHVIEVTGHGGSSKAIQVAVIARELLSSEATDNDVYRKITEIAEVANDAEAFQNAATAVGAQIRSANNVHIFDENIIGLGPNRDIVRWAFDSDRRPGDVHIDRTSDNAYVVVHLTDIVDGDYEPFEVVRETIEDKLFNQKKAEYIRKQIQASVDQDDLAAIAENMGVASSSIQLTFSQNSIDRAGNDPKAVGGIFGIEENKVRVIEGDRAVYAVRVTATVNAPEQESYEDEKEAYLNNLRGKVEGAILISKKENATIKDNRHRFF
jgi:peptidyl-prolyl cis-trans isomerase D